MAELRIVGTPQPRMPGGPDMATGQAQFREDIKLPRMVYLRTKHSPHAHAIVKKIDTTQAEAMPGVLLVLTGENLPQEFEHLREVAFQPEKRVRYAGEIVAIVVAKSEEIAEEALDLIQIEYEPLPAVFDIDEALKSEAPLVNSQFPGNFRARAGIIERGDVEKAF